MSKVAVNPLRTENVFLDTSVFIEANFGYVSPRFESLAVLAADRRVRLFLSDITVREIKCHLKELVERAAAHRPPAILRNSTRPQVLALLEAFDAHALATELEAQFENFLQRTGATVLAHDSKALQAVLDWYFARRAPFGPGKNKAEFPDAIALSALSQWCEQNRASMAIVARDDAIREACVESLFFHHFDDLGKYLDAVESENEELKEFICSELGRHRTEIIESATDAFSSFGFFLRDQNGEVDEVILQEIDYDDEPYVISLRGDGAIVELSASLSFRASLVYDTPGTGTYDKEEGLLLFGETTHEEVDRTVQRDISLELAFMAHKPSSSTVVRAWFDAPHDIQIESDFDRDWPYK